MASSDDQINTTQPLSDQSEQEPRLAYGRFGSDVPGILAAQSACRLCVSDKLLALGTEDGAVHLLAYDGNKIKSFQEHQGPVTDLSFDDSAESLASCSSDGTIAIYGLYTGTVQRHSYPHAITTVALDPRFSGRKTQEFIYGTAAGALVLSSKGWLGHSETVLFRGRGPVHIARMSGTLLAWATDSGIRVYDTSTHGKVGKIDRPSSVTPGVECGALEWVGKKQLFIAWGSHVMAVDVVRRWPGHNEEGPQTNPAVPDAVPIPAAHGGVGASGGPMSMWKLEVSSTFAIKSGQAVGVAPFGCQVAVLTWNSKQNIHSNGGGREGDDDSDDAVRAVVNDDDDDDNDEGNVEESGDDDDALGRASTAHLSIYNRSGHEMFSDVVILEGLDRSSNGSRQLHLSAYFGHGCIIAPSNPTTNPPVSAAPPGQHQQQQQQPYKWWADGEEPLYYILGGKDISIGRPRTSTDRIAWLSERLRFAEAVTVAESDPGVSTATRTMLAEQYLQYLFIRKAYQEAAALCPRLLLEDASAWERWVYAFGQAAKLPVLAGYLPVDRPTLSPSVYDLVLAACLRTSEDHSVLLSLLRSWPSSIYDASALLKLVCARSAAAVHSPSSPPSTAAGNLPDQALRRAASILHSHVGQHEEALRILLQLRAPEAFEYVRTHSLTAVAATLADQLVVLDEVRAISFLVEAWEEAPPAAVVESLQRAIQREQQEAGGGINGVHTQKKSQNVESRRLYHYLDWLWQKEASAAAPFAALHVELCAAHDPDRLLGLLTSSTAYPLDAALDVTERAGLVRESVYILGRMGAADTALKLIVGRLRDVEGAVTFVKEQHDEELWDLLISLTFGDATLAGELLDHAGGAMDPRQLVYALPAGMEIEGLRDRLVCIIRDFQAALLLQKGCHAVLKTDCLDLTDELYARLRRALRRLSVRHPGGRWGIYDVIAGLEEAVEGEAGHGLGAGGDEGIEGGNTFGLEGASPYIWVGVRPPGVTANRRHQVAPPPASVHSSPSKFPRKSPRRRQ